MDKTAKKRLGLLGLGVSVIALVLLLQSISAQSPSVSYELVTGAGDNRPAYTPTCTYSCYLPVEFSLNEDWTVDASKFSKSFKWVKNGPLPDVQIEFGRLENVTAKDWSTFCSPFTHENGSLGKNCSAVSTDTTVQQWVWSSLQDVDGFNAKAHERYTVLLSTRNKNPRTSVDVVPELQGFNLTEFAQWNGTTLNLNETFGMLVRYEFNCSDLYGDRSEHNLDLQNVSSNRCTTDDRGLADEAIEFTGSSQLRNNTHANQVFPYNTTITVLAVVKTALIDQRALWALSDNLSSTFGIYGKFGAFAVGGDGLAFGRFHDANHFIEIKNANQPTLEYQDRWACFTYYWNATGTDASESLTMYLNGTPLVTSNELNSGAMSWTNESLTIGSLPSGGEPFVGNLSLWTAYDRKLNRTEIDALCAGFNPLNTTSELTESEGDLGIDAGIAASTASSGANTTERQVYIRYLDGTQKLGIFDRTLSEGNQRWLFLYRTGSENFTAMDNISTALYVWERESMTSSAITDAVQAIINSTDQ